MVFWIAILTGVLFVWLAVRLGFYETWALLFNILVAVYVAIFLAPIVAEAVPMPGRASWCTGLSMLVLGGGCFALLHGLSWVLLTGQFRVRFPSLFDVVLSGGLGFVAGFLVLSFAALTLSTTPLARNKIVRTLGVDRQGQRVNIAGIAYCCDLIHRVAGFADDSTTRSAITRLLDTSTRLSETDKAPPEPNEANEPNATGADPTRPAEPKEAKPPRGLHRRTLPTESFD
jgi:hypothetical protein